MAVEFVYEPGWLGGAGATTGVYTSLIDPGVHGSGVAVAVIDTGIGRPPGVFDDAVAGGTDVSGSGTPDGRTPVGAVDANHGTLVASLQPVDP